MNSRRSFLKVLGTTAVLPICGGCGPADRTGRPEAHGPVAGGNVSELQLGRPKLAKGKPVVIILDSGGVYAMTTVCTHQQCDMRDDGNITVEGLSCDCHSSKFDINGSVTDGPASHDLKHYLVEIDASGEITVQADNVVDASERTPKPA